MLLYRKAGNSIYSSVLIVIFFHFLFFSWWTTPPTPETKPTPMPSCKNNVILLSLFLCDILNGNPGTERSVLLPQQRQIKSSGLVHRSNRLTDYKARCMAEREFFSTHSCPVHMQILCSEYTVSKVCYFNKFNFIWTLYRVIQIISKNTLHILQHKLGLLGAMS